MLPESARAVMGVPHPSGRAAMKMLEREGFKYDHYIDIFDGGPTVSVATDQIRTIRESNEYTLSGVSDDWDSDPVMLAAVHLKDFRACSGNVGLGDVVRATRAPTASELPQIGSTHRFLTMGSRNTSRNHPHRHHPHHPQTS